MPDVFYLLLPDTEKLTGLADVRSQWFRRYGDHPEDLPVLGNCAVADCERPAVTHQLTGAKRKTGDLLGPPVFLLAATCAECAAQAALPHSLHTASAESEV